MNNHIPTLQTCQRLKELGYPQDSLFYWYKRLLENKELENNILSEENVVTLADAGDSSHYEKRCAAPLTLELLDQFKGWAIEFHGKSITVKDYRQGLVFDLEGITFTESAALMWIYLKEKGLI